MDRVSILFTHAFISGTNQGYQSSAISPKGESDACCGVVYAKINKTAKLPAFKKDSGGKEVSNRKER
jgi:hypothetical protein